MSLPAIKVPTFFVTLPSTQKDIRLKSMTTKDYKLLLVVKEGSDDKQIFNTILQVIENCVDETIDLKSLPWFDIEYIFVKLMGSSTAQRMIPAKFKCKNKVSADENGEEECGNIITQQFDIGKAEVVLEGPQEKIIEVEAEEGANIFLKFEYPKFDTIINNLEGDNFKVIADCLTSVTQGEVVNRKGSDYNTEDAAMYVDNLGSSVLEELGEFFDKMPTLKATYEIECNKCGHKHETTLAGMQDFFI